MVSRSSRVDEGPYLWEGGRGGGKASALLGIIPGILEHVLSALESSRSESYRLLDRPENMRMALLPIWLHFLFPRMLQ